MATLRPGALDEIVDELLAMGEEAGDVCERMLDAGAEEVKKAWKTAAERHQLRHTGAMIESIDTAARSKRQARALYRDIYPQGKDAKGTSNAMKAYVLHYGTSRIKARYWVDEANDAAEGPMADAMRAVWNDYIDKRGGS